jgi:hypothetical protein
VDRALTLLLERGRTKEAGGGGEAAACASYPPGTDTQDWRTSPIPATSRRREAGVMAPRWRAVWIRLGGRTSMHRAHVPGVPPRDSVRDEWPRDDRQHLAALPAAQSVRGGAGLRRRCPHAARKGTGTGLGGSRACRRGAFAPALTP